MEKNLGVLAEYGQELLCACSCNTPMSVRQRALSCAEAEIKASLVWKPDGLAFVQLATMEYPSPGGVGRY